MANLLEQVIEEFRIFPQIRAIVLSGSTSVNYSDALSDNDIYIYSDSEIDVDMRRRIASKFTPCAEINNQYFETGDEWKIPNSVGIDIMYRTPEWIEEQINRVWVNHSVSVGYSTCFLYNVLNSIILFDCNCWFKELKDALNTPYPSRLKENIISKNLPLLIDKPSASYCEQIKVALKREDLVSVNHRISAFLASYFDVLFALNELLHPGEKRLIRYATDNCRLLPDDFEKDIVAITTHPLENTLDVLERLAFGLRGIIK